ncbi:hypothetical protein HHUSO_G13867 [Huso huso]|uniref:Uncharacterized protein n=1 Tax=Huso huso TaxID=61971 RepID=A0ABR0ZHF2_HUSHU
MAAHFNNQIHWSREYLPLKQTVALEALWLVAHLQQCFKHILIRQLQRDLNRDSPKGKICCISVRADD